MRQHVFLALISLSTAAVAGVTPDTQTSSSFIDESCQTYNGIADNGELARFDKELKDSLTETSIDQLSFLVKYPLKFTDQNSDNMGMYDTETLQRNYDKVFNITVKDAIQKTALKDIACMEYGVMYGHGKVWVDRDIVDEKIAYRIRYINSKQSDNDNAVNTVRFIRFACNTLSYRVVVDSSSEDTRFRVWRKPKPVKGTPDIEILASPDAGVFGGTGSCAGVTWTFERGSVRYLVSPGKPECGEGSTPKDSVGMYMITDKKTSHWEYEYCK